LPFSWFFEMVHFLLTLNQVEIARYICRFLGHNDTGAMTLYIIQTLTILVEPAPFVASIYMVLGRLIRLVKGKAYLPFKHSILTKTFEGV
jgi:hypothetical protein